MTETIIPFNKTTKEIHQVLIWVAGREQPIMLAYRKFDDAVKVGERACSMIATVEEPLTTLHDDFGQVAQLPGRPVATVVSDPQRALELQMELTMLQQIAQVRFQAKVQNDPALKAAAMFAQPGGFPGMPRG